MVTVPQAADRLGRNPETIRRWIRSGRLRATKVGTQHMIDERDLESLSEESISQIRLPDAWRVSRSGEPAPNWVDLLHQARRER
ncbi:MAG: helix-turn-helix domain-containing protein [Actinobacteria bacterium]|nr:helix-turn-helix domain-containing protein [Actinomycetota bacterium]